MQFRLKWNRVLNVAFFPFHRVLFIFSFFLFIFVLCFEFNEKKIENTYCILKHAMFLFIYPIRFMHCFHCKQSKNAFFSLYLQIETELFFSINQSLLNFRMLCCGLFRCMCDCLSQQSEYFPVYICRFYLLFQLVCYFCFIEKLKITYSWPQYHASDRHNHTRNNNHIESSICCGSSRRRNSIFVDL